MTVRAPLASSTLRNSDKSIMLPGEEEMEAMSTAVELTQTNPPVVPDGITNMLFKSWDELFGMDRQEVERFQLSAAATRFSTLAPRVSALAAQAEQAGVTGIESLNDI